MLDQVLSTLSGWIPIKYIRSSGSSKVVHIYKIEEEIFEVCNAKVVTTKKYKGLVGENKLVVHLKSEDGELSIQPLN